MREVFWASLRWMIWVLYLIKFGMTNCVQMTMAGTPALTITLQIWILTVLIRTSSRQDIKTYKESS